jgi:hypothetical protein
MALGNLQKTPRSVFENQPLYHGTTTRCCPVYAAACHLARQSSSYQGQITGLPPPHLAFSVMPSQFGPDVPAAQSRQRSGSQPSDAIEIEDSERENESPVVLTSSPVRSRAHGSPMLPNRDMPPPALLPPPRLRLEHDVAAPIPVAPSPSLPIRPAGSRAKQTMAQITDSSSSPLHPPPPSQKRLYRRDHRKDSDSHTESHASKSHPGLSSTSPSQKKEKAHGKVHQSARYGRGGSTGSLDRCRGGPLGRRSEQRSRVAFFLARKRRRQAVRCGFPGHTAFAVLRPVGGVQTESFVAGAGAPWKWKWK